MATITRAPVGYFRGTVKNLIGTINPEFWLLIVYFEYQDTPPNVLSDAILIGKDTYQLASACEVGKTYIFELSPSASQPNISKNRPLASVNYRLLSAKSA